MTITEILAGGGYKPYWINGVHNPECDKTSRLMMDFKDANHPNNRNATTTFSNIAYNALKGGYFTENNQNFVDLNFAVTVAPSSTQGTVRASLVDVAKALCDKVEKWTYYPLLERHTTVASSHSGGGVRQVSTHTESIRTINQSIIKAIDFVIVLDDVKTTGSTLKACASLIEATSPSTTVIPFALLETTY